MDVLTATQFWVSFAVFSHTELSAPFVPRVLCSLVFSLRVLHLQSIWETSLTTYSTKFQCVQLYLSTKPSDSGRSFPMCSYEVLYNGPSYWLIPAGGQWQVVFHWSTTEKDSLDQEIFNNFRPISNLVYISKLIEKVIASRLHSHMTNNNLYEELQSSYRKFHSTETALTCVHDDILRAIDDNKSVLLIMLDLSAAFDTVDHDVLLERLKSGLGICGTALNWFKSYLSGRSQSVLINGTQSKPTSLVCGVPQGSVLGPILFTIYMLPLGDIIKRHGMQFHMYADDCQLYTTFEASDINQTALNMEILIDDIRGWYSENMLKLNDSKTEMMVISSKFRPSVHLDHIKIGESSISPSETVRNLGVIMDSNYTMVSHINHKVQ